MSIEIRRLSVDDGREVYDVMSRMPRCENGVINSIYGKTFEEYKLWLKGTDERSRKKRLIEGWKVPQTTYWLFKDGKLAGFGKIRHFLTDELKEHGGNIAYDIIPSYRNMGLGKELLRLLLEKCRDMNMERTLLTINLDNIPSLHVALANGGVVEKTSEKYYYVWIDLLEPQLSVVT